MHHQAGVRTIVAGGRPELGPMQAVGGSRGAEIYDAVSLDADIEFAQLVNQSFSFPDRSVGAYINYATFNLKDSIRQGENIPLQFVFEAATCRIFYTTRTVYNYLNLWNYVVDAIWRNPSLCIAGSANGTTSSNTNTTGPSTNDKAILASSEANIPSLILSGLQSGPQHGPESGANTNKKRDMLSSPPSSPTIPNPDDPLRHVNNDGLANGSPCSGCTRAGFTCAAVPTCTQGKVATASSCVQLCSKNNNPCNPNSQNCHFQGASGFCIANKLALAVQQCKPAKTSSSSAQQTQPVGGGNNHLPYAKLARKNRGGP